MNRAANQSEREFLSGLRQVSFSAAERKAVGNGFALFPRTSSLASVRNDTSKITYFESEEEIKRRPRNVFTAGNLASLDSHDSGVWVSFDKDKRNTLPKVGVFSKCLNT